MSRPMDVGNAMRHCSMDSFRNLLRDFASMVRCGDVEGSVSDYHVPLFCEHSNVVLVMREWPTKVRAD